MRQKLKSKKFWLSLAGVTVMLLQLFGIKVDGPYVNEIVDSICAVLILIGLIDPQTDKGDHDENFSQRVCSTGTVL